MPKLASVRATWSMPKPLPMAERYTSASGRIFCKARSLTPTDCDWPQQANACAISASEGMSLRVLPAPNPQRSISGPTVTSKRPSVAALISCAAAITCATSGETAK